MYHLISLFEWLQWWEPSSDYFKLDTLLNILQFFFEVLSSDNNIYTCELQVNEL